jgi:hypothetical protein
MILCTMQLLIDGTELPLAGGISLSASYLPQEIGLGSLNLRCNDVVTYDTRTICVPLDPWCPDGYRIEQALGGKALVVCGATRIVVIEMPCLRVKAAIPLEYEECETQGLPWFVIGSGVMLIATETRVFCLDERIAFRWCWTVAAYSKDWWQISQAPRIDATTVRIALTRLNRNADVHLDLLAATVLP